MAKLFRGMRTALLVISPEWQARAAPLTDESGRGAADAYVAELRGAYSRREAVPPLRCVQMLDGSLALVDGLHRWAAIQKEGIRTVDVEVLAERVKREDVVWWAATANRTHGWRRTNADKRRAVTMALTHENAADMSVADIADHCGVGESLVREVREVLLAPVVETEREEREAKAAAIAKAIEENPDGSNVQVAKKAGVTEGAVRKARKRHDPRIAPIRDGATTETLGNGTVARPWEAAAEAHDSMIEAVDRLRRETAEARKAMANGVAQQVDQHIAALLGTLRQNRPEECPKCGGAGCDRCQSSGYMRAESARTLRSWMERGAT